MALKDILGVVVSMAEDEPVFAALEALAGDKARAAALLIELAPDPVYTTEGAVVSAAWSNVLEQSSQEFLKHAEAFKRRCEEASPPIAGRQVIAAPGRDCAEAAMRARLTDLIVMLRPIESWSQARRSKLFEAALFGSGRPVLLVPPAWRKRTIGRSIAVGWNGSREATRVLADAAPLLDHAEKVMIMTVDPHPRSSRPTGAEVASYLARRGAMAEHLDIESRGRGDSHALLAEAEAAGADLVVIGGYGTPRLREMVFGGVTRTLTQESNLPVFLSH